MSARLVTHLAAFALASAGALSCVPASEPADPAGAIGFVTEPTAASRGEPFTTDDGWTVRIEWLVMQLHVSASTSTIGNESGGRQSGDYAEYRFAGHERTELYGRGLNAGPASATAVLGGGYVDEYYDDYGSEDRIEIIGVPSEISARFRRAAEANGGGTSYASYSGPSVLLVAHGEKAGRTVTVDFTMAASSYSLRGAPSVEGEVRADALTVAPLVVSGEALFVDEALGQLLFGPFADADADADGVTTGAELAATTTVAVGRGTLPPPKAGLVDVLYARAARLLLTP